MSKHDYAREPYEKLARDLPGDELAVSVSLTIRLHRNGALSVEGPVADPAFCRQLLDHAWDAIQRQTKPQPLLVVPERDVGIKP
jgi:hypothetical protein